MSGKKVVPITREFLRKHYEKLVIDPEPAVFSEIRLTATQICHTLHGVIVGRDPEFEDLRSGLTTSAPKRIDENFYRNREQCERISVEILTDATLKKLSSSHSAEIQSLATALASFRGQMQSTADSIQKYQKERQQSVEELVRKFLPNDFRMTLLTKYRERSERKNTEAMEALRKSGATIHEVYNSLWDQQMARRATLVQLGQASGAFKMFLRLLAGVPQVLLDFVRTINDEQGPMEEMRARYGPFIYRLTEFATLLRIFVQMVVHSLEVSSPDVLGVSIAEIQSIVQAGGAAYTGACVYYLYYMLKVWDASPFFMEELQGNPALAAEPATEIVVPAGKKHVVVVDVPTAGWTLAWEFEVKSNDIAFSLTESERIIIPGSGVATPVAKDQGSIVTEKAGPHTLCFDNSFSYFTKKKISLRTMLVAPDVVSAVSDDAAPSTAAAAAAAAEPAQLVHPMSAPVLPVPMDSQEDTPQ